jgi:predicted nucleotidyltransferase
MHSELAAMAEKYGILLALLFGSSATGKTRAGSDLDIAVLLNRPEIPFCEHADLLEDLQQLFPEREVDLAIINHADPLFLKKITDECQILYGPVERLQRLKIYAFKRYQDHRKFFDMERRYAARYSTAARPAE